MTPWTEEWRFSSTSHATSRSPWVSPVHLVWNRLRLKTRPWPDMMFISTTSSRSRTLICWFLTFPFQIHSVIMCSEVCQGCCLGDQEASWPAAKWINLSQSTAAEIAEVSSDEQDSEEERKAEKIFSNCGVKMLVWWVEVLQLEEMRMMQRQKKYKEEMAQEIEDLCHPHYDLKNRICCHF